MYTKEEAERLKLALQGRLKDEMELKAVSKRMAKSMITVESPEYDEDPRGGELTEVEAATLYVLTVTGAKDISKLEATDVLMLVELTEKLEEVTK